MQFSKCLFFLLLITIVFLNPLCLSKTLASELEVVTIDKVNTFPYSIKEGWISLPKTDGTLTVTITAINAKRIKFYLIPTGTATYNQRKLIGSSEGKNGEFVFKWNFKGDQDIFHHFAVEVINSKNQIANTGVLFNVTNE
ncbi:hypothetical protein [Bacillus toyonensis]|uniref:hypothetical protein n=1 Tax=Bacillus toyonensis TaxID=155322 RepID=UPI000BFD0D41|nr:hypothetical protein [Bacillus toyonensis]PHG56461.1 hypothetical protein COI59_31475 [Bacillus toyonensis]